ncbi:MAG: enoyl-CoA hydratase-related protein [Ilumatobacteraceae bacterium]
MDAAELTEVRLTVDDGVALLELDRPDRRNAWSGRMAVEYRWALHLADTDPAARVVVVTGAGRDFCIGADTGAIETISGQGGAYTPERAAPAPFPDGTPDHLRRNHAYPWTLSVPVIAAVNGACAGAGFVVATYADIRIAAADARIATSFAGLGLPAEFGAGWVLPRLVGVPNALQMLLDPAAMSAARAAELGWVQHVVPGDQLVAEAVVLARHLARTSSADSLRWMKRSVLIDAGGDFGDAYTRSVDEMDEALRRPDLRAAITARREGRRHDFLVPGD